MADARSDTDELPPAQRRYVVDQARANLRAHAVEQSPALYRLYELYAVGALTRGELRAELDTLRANRTRKSENPSPGGEILFASG